MPGDVIPFESEVLVLAKLTGWLPQDIEAMPAVYYDNLRAAWATLNAAERARNGR